MDQLDKPTVNPPRRRWPRIVFLGFLLTSVGLWLSWSHHARARLNSKLESIRARYESLALEDYASPRLPDEQNAATYLVRAADSISQEILTPSESGTVFPSYPVDSAQWISEADAAVRTNASALQDARKARSISNADWKYRPSPADLVPHMPPLNPLRNLANTLADAALDAHFHGDDHEAFERITDLFHEADAIDQCPEAAVHLTALGIDAMAIEFLAKIAPDLKVDGTDDSTLVPAFSVNRAQVRRLISALLDDRSALARAKRVAMYERAWKLAWIASVRARSTVLRPMFDLEGVRAIDDFAVTLTAYEQPNWPAAQLILPNGKAISNAYFPPAPKPPANRESRMLSSQLIYHYQNVEVLLEWNGIASRRALAISLAIRLFRIDHHRWPAALGELVPQYLPEIPGDPLDPQNGPIRYLTIHPTAGADRPMLLHDAPANPGLPPPVPVFEHSGPGPRWLDLSRWSPPPTIAPTTLPSS
jgi:hypothetical protein